MPDLLTEITHAAKAYYAQGPALGITPTDFHDWASTLALARWAHVRAQGFAAAKAGPKFLRYCLEWRGYDVWIFMAGRLSVAAFTLWATNGEFNGDLPPHGIGR